MEKDLSRVRADVRKRIEGKDTEITPTEPNPVRVRNSIMEQRARDRGNNGR